MAVTATGQVYNTTIGNIDPQGDGSRTLQAVQTLNAVSITETGSTDASGLFTMSTLPVDPFGLFLQADSVVVNNIKAAKQDATQLYTRYDQIDFANKKVKLFTDETLETVAASLNNVTISYWYLAPSQGNYDVTARTFIPYVGAYGSTLAEQKTQADAVTNVITFSKSIYAIEIYHEDSVWQTFTVNGLTLNIPAGGYRSLIGGTSGTTVSIPAGLNCIVGRLV